MKIMSYFHKQDNKILLLLFLLNLVYSQLQSYTNNDDLMLFSPKITSQFKTSVITYDLVQMKDSNITIIISYNGQVQIVDFTDLTNPFLINEITVAQVINDLQLSENQQYLFLSCIQEGLKILDISNLSKVKNISEYKNNGWNIQSHCIFKKETNNNQYIALGIDGNFAILNITNIQLPSLVSNISTGGAQNSQTVITNEGRFAILSERSLGIAIIDVTDKSNPILAGRLKFNNKMYYFVIHPLKPLLCTYVSYTGLYCLDFGPFYTLPYPLSMSNITNKNFMFTSSLRRLSISNDGNFIFMGIREKGVNIVDFRQGPKIYPKHFIQSNDQLYFPAVRLSHDQNYLYIINAAGVGIYSRIQKPNLNKDRPNLHHYYNQQIIPTPWLASAGSRFSPSIDGTQVFVAQQQAGWNSFNTTDPYNVTLNYKYPSTSSCVVDHVHQSPSFPQFLYVTCQTKGLQIYNITNPKSAKLVSTTTTPKTATLNMVLELKTNPDILIAMTYYEGLQVFNVSNKTKPVFLKSFPIPGQMRDMIINREETIIYSTIRDYGIVTWDISNISDFKILDYIMNSSPEIMKFSQDQKYLFMADGPRGFTIYDCTTPQKLKEVSNLWLGSWGYEIALTKDDNYIIISAWATQPNIMLIDIVDKLNPLMIQTFGAYEISSSIILINNDKTLLINTQPFQINVLPMIIPQAILTVTFKTGEINIIDPKETLKVGQNIEMHISSLDYTTQKQITGAAHYSKNSLMSDNLNVTCGERLQSCYIQLEITKEFEGPNYLEINSIMQVSETDFLDDSLGINATIATNIVKFLQRNKLIDANLFPTKNVNLEMDIQSLVELQQPQWLNITGKINTVMLSKVYIFPSYFIVESSLIFSHRKTDNNIIQTITSQALFVSLQIDSDQQAQWYNSPQQGAVIYFSENDTKLQLSARVDQLNQILKEIKITNYIDKNQVMINFYINDQINYPNYAYYSLEELPFLSINRPVKLKVSLDEQFKKKFNDKNQVYIQEESSFSFSKDTFSDDDELKYTALAYIDGDFKPIPKDYHVQFSASERIFTFTPKTQHFQTSSQILLIASDGYTQNTDSLTINFDLVPFLFVVQIIMIIGGPLVGLLGALKYRVQLYNIFYKRKFTYSKDFVRANQEYKKQIPLILNLQVGAEKIMTRIKQKLKKNKTKIDEFINKDNQQINIEILQQYLEQIINEEAQQATKNKSQENVKNRENSKINLDANSLNRRPEKANTITLNQLQSQTQIASTNDELQLGKIQIKSQLTSRKANELLVLISDLQEENQSLWNIIISKLYQEKLKSDKNLLKFYQQLKSHSDFYGKFKNKDWYKAYIKIEPQIGLQTQPTLFPKVEFIQRNLFNALILIYNKMFPKQKITNQQNLDLQKLEINPFNSIIYEKIFPAALQQYFPLINVAIIIQNIYGDALGMNENNFLEYSNGESLNCKPLEIFQCQAYKKIEVENKFIYRILSLINYNYVQQELANNSSLPKWLTCQSDPIGFLYLQGTPQEKDQGEFLIRIEKSDTTIMKQFNIVVLSDQKREKSMITNRTRRQQQAEQDLRKVNQMGGQTRSNIYIIQEEVDHNKENEGQDQRAISEKRINLNSNQDVLLIPFDDDNNNESMTKDKEKTN